MMKAKQLFYVLCAILALLCLGFVGIAYATNKVLGGESNKLSLVRAETVSLETQQRTLGKNKQDIEKYGGLNDIAKAVVPQDKDQAAAVSEIVNIARQSGIAKLSSITFPMSTLGAGAVGGTVLPKSSAGSSLTQLTPVKGMSGIYELQITVTLDDTSKIPYSQFMTFLSKLEQNRRTAQVSSITVTPDQKSPNMVSFTLVINEYIKP